MKKGTTIITLHNGYHLWTNTQGEGTIHLLCLHGGPGANHEYWEDTATQLAKQGLNVQVHMYDQLGSLYSDTPDFSDPAVRKEVLTYDYFLNEVEEVRQKLGIDQFYLMGQSWGGLLVQLYAAKFGNHLKGAIISGMVDDIDDYVKSINHIRETVLPAEDVAFMKECEAKDDYDNERYQKCVDVLNKGYIDRRQPSKLEHLQDLTDPTIYNTFQGDNEFVITGKLADWHFRDHLKDIKVPTLVTFGGHETMPIPTGKKMAELIPHARFVTTPDAGHHQMTDNPGVFYKHVAVFIKEVETDSFNE